MSEQQNELEIIDNSDQQAPESEDQQKQEEIKAQEPVFIEPCLDQIDGGSTPRESHRPLDSDSGSKATKNHGQTESVDQIQHSERNGSQKSPMSEAIKHTTNQSQRIPINTPGNEKHGSQQMSPNVKKQSQQSSQQQMTNLIGTRQKGKNFVTKRSSVNNNMIQTVLRHQTSLNEDLQILDAGNKDGMRASVGGQKTAQKPPLMKKKKSVDQSHQSLVVNKDKNGKPNEYSAQKQSDSPNCSFELQKTSTIPHHPENASGQYEFKPNDQGSLSLMQNDEKGEMKAKQMSNGQQEGMKEVLLNIVINTEAEQKGDSDISANQGKKILEARDSLRIANDDYLDEDISKAQPTAPNAGDPRDPQLAGTLKMGVDLSSEQQQQFLQNKDSVMPAPGPTDNTKVPQIPALISVTNKQRNLDQGNLLGPGNEREENPLNLSMTPSEGPAAPLDSPNALDAAYYSLNPYVNQRGPQQAVPFKARAGGPITGFTQPLSVDQQQLRMLLMAQQLYRGGPKQPDRTQNPSLDLNTVLTLSKRGQLSARSGSVSPRSVNYDNASYLSSARQYNDSNSQNRRELGSVAQRIQSQGLTQNVGLAQKQARTMQKANHLLEQAALSQQQWMYDFKDSSPLRIGSIQKPKNYMVKRQLFQKPAPVSPPSDEAKRKNPVAQHSYNLDLSHVKNEDPGLGQTFGRTALASTDRQFNDFSLMLSSASPVNEPRDPREPNQTTQPILAKVPFDAQSQDLAGDEGVDTGRGANSRFGLNADQADQPLPAIGNIAIERDDPKEVGDEKAASPTTKERSESKKGKQRYDIKTKQLAASQNSSRTQSRKGEKGPVAAGQSPHLSERGKSFSPPSDRSKEVPVARPPPQFHLEFNDVKAVTQKLKFEPQKGNQLQSPSPQSTLFGSQRVRRQGQNQQSSKDQLTFQGASQVTVGSKSNKNLFDQLGRLGELAPSPNKGAQGLLQKDQPQFSPDVSNLQLVGRQAQIQTADQRSSQNRHSNMSKFSRFEQGTGLDSMMINSSNIQFQYSRMNERGEDVSGGFGQSNHVESGSFKEYSVLSHKDRPNYQTVMPTELGKDNMSMAKKPKPALGSIAAEINPRFNHKSLYRRNLLQKQSELMRSHNRKAGTIKSIGDVVKQAKQQKNQIKRNEKLKEYLSDSHNFWQDTVADESLLLEKSIDTERQGNECIEQLMQSLKTPPVIHYNEKLISNYKYFGARKFPEIDKILIQDNRILLPNQRGKMQDSLCTSSISDGISIMPSISIKDGGAGAFNQIPPSTRQTIKPKSLQPKTKQASRKAGNDTLLFSRVRQTLRTESQPLRDGVQRDIHTAFMNSQFQGIAPSTAKNFNNIRRRMFNTTTANNGSTWSNMNAATMLATGSTWDRRYGTLAGAPSTRQSMERDSTPLFAAGPNYQQDRQNQRRIIDGKHQFEDPNYSSGPKSLKHKANHESVHQGTKGESSFFMGLPQVASSGHPEQVKGAPLRVAAARPSQQMTREAIQKGNPKVPKKAANTQRGGGAGGLSPVPSGREDTTAHFRSESCQGTVSYQGSAQRRTQEAQQDEIPTVKSVDKRSNDSGERNPGSPDKHSSPFQKTASPRSPDSQRTITSPSPPFKHLTKPGRAQRKPFDHSTATNDQNRNSKQNKKQSVSQSTKTELVMATAARQANNRGALTFQKRSPSIITADSPFYVLSPAQYQAFNPKPRDILPLNSIPEMNNGRFLGNSSFHQTNHPFLKNHKQYQKKYRQQKQLTQINCDRAGSGQTAAREEDGASGKRDASVGGAQKEVASTGYDEHEESTGEIIIINPKNPMIPPFPLGTPMRRTPADGATPPQSTITCPSVSRAHAMRHSGNIVFGHGGAPNYAAISSMIYSPTDLGSQNRPSVLTSAPEDMRGDVGRSGQFQHKDPKLIIKLSKPRQDDGQFHPQKHTVFNIISAHSQRGSNQYCTTLQPSGEIDQQRPGPPQVSGTKPVLEKKTSEEESQLGDVQRLGALTGGIHSPSSQAVESNSRRLSPKQ